jgi:hypothetical protein
METLRSIDYPHPQEMNHGRTHRRFTFFDVPNQVFSQLPRGIQYNITVFPFAWSLTQAGI